MPNVHGHVSRVHTSRTYNTWRTMTQRCTNPKATKFENYGGRGITVCERWRVFNNFLADMGERPLDRSLDRIDSDGNYEPGNCRWATHVEQNRNRRGIVWVEANGERLCLTDWAARLGMASRTISLRLSAGWDPARAVTEPPHLVGERLRRARLKL